MKKLLKYEYFLKALQITEDTEFFNMLKLILWLYFYVFWWKVDKDFLFQIFQFIWLINT